MTLGFKFVDTIINAYREGAGTDDQKPAPAAGDQKPAPAAGDQKPFTQEDVNRMLAEDRRKHKLQQDKLFAELEAIKSKSQLTSQERQDLETRLEQLKTESMTKEELAKRNQEKLQKEYSTKIDELSKNADSWKTRYTSATITRAITDAAVSSNAFNPSQLVAQLANATRLTEVLDADGKSTGDYDVKVKVTDKDKEGKSVILELPVVDAVKRLREQPEFMNLFKDTSAGGTGSTNTGSGGGLDARKLAASDPDTYARLRREGKLKLQ